MKKLVATALFVCLLSACQSDPSKTAITEYCDCIAPIKESSEKMMARVSQGSMEGMGDMIANMNKNVQAVQGCISDMMTKYKDKENDEEFKSKVQAGIEKQCPMPKPGMRR